MSYTEWKDIAQAIQSVVTSVALIVGGIWAYSKFRYRREREPRAEFDFDVTFAGSQDGRVLVEINAYVENRGSVRHPVQDLSITIRHLLETDQIVDGAEAINFQTIIPHSVKRTLWQNTYIDPGIKHRNSYITSVPAEATFFTYSRPLLLQWRGVPNAALVQGATISMLRVTTIQQTTK